jgi:hypothetical protein
MAMIWRVAFWRCRLLEREYVRRYGTVVQDGPFKGMQYLSRTNNECYLPKLLGCFEGELHDHVREIVTAGYESVLNIGCAEGYYTVGLARLLPGARIFAHDTDPKAQAACRRLAEVNGVKDRVEVGGVIRGEDFSRFASQRSLVFCDIEGGEAELLDPERFPALRHIDVIVELHESLVPQISNRLAQRFGPSHEVRIIERGRQLVHLPEMFDHMSEFFRFLAVCEWRAGFTRWAIMRSRAREPMVAPVGH